MAKFRSKRSEERNKFIFISGLVLFLVGILGFFVYKYFFQAASLDKIFPDDVAIFLEVAIDRSSADLLEEMIPVDLNALINTEIGDRFEFDFEEDVLPWVGRVAGIAVFGNGETVVATTYRSRGKTEEFLNKFKLPNEKFNIQEISGGEIWNPEFSSNLVFAFYKNYVLFASSKDALTRTLYSNEKLIENEDYREIKKDRVRNSVVSSFVNTGNLLEFMNMEEFASIQPFFDILQQTFPAFGFGLKVNDYGVSIETKVLSSEGIFKKRDIPNNSREDMMPALAKLAPQNTLFFMNGYDFYSKYLHTKDFLTRFNTQFPIIFDGILRASSKNVFGEGFDLEKDFLSQMKGDYAFLLDVENEDLPFVDITLITGFGGIDVEQNISQIHEALRFAQGKFAPETRKVELVDGTIREELIAVASDNIEIEKIKFEDYTYFSAKNSKPDAKKFSYGFVDGNFVFSTHAKGLESIIATASGKAKSLAENEDFKKSVFLYYSLSESYGFLNLSKLARVSEFLWGIPIFDENEDSTLRDMFYSNFRNLTFSRKVFPGELFMKGVLFFR